ncbi:MAG: hypothetical protein ABI614_12235 [Planctomycetota bacterium]
MRRCAKGAIAPATLLNDLHALLIGVDHYFPNRLPDGGYYGGLNGCVRDVLHVENYLTDYLRVPSDNIRKLTISVDSGSHPQEPSEQWPTYENMVKGLQRL